MRQRGNERNVKYIPLWQCSYRGSSPPPPKPQRTYTHQLKHQLSCPAPATQHQLSCPAGSPTLPSTLKGLFMKIVRFYKIMMNCNRKSFFL